MSRKYDTGVDLAQLQHFYQTNNRDSIPISWVSAVPIIFGDTALVVASTELKDSQHTVFQGGHSILYKTSTEFFRSLTTQGQTLRSCDLVKRLQHGLQRSIASVNDDMLEGVQLFTEADAMSWNEQGFSDRHLSSLLDSIKAESCTYAPVGCLLKPKVSFTVDNQLVTTVAVMWASPLGEVQGLIREGGNSSSSNDDDSRGPEAGGLLEEPPWFVWYRLGAHRPYKDDWDMAYNQRCYA